MTDIVREAYSDAYLTAHFEVPGEMFKLALEAGSRGAGVVGSTSNILDFISSRLDEALERPFPERLRFVLGTETGMATSIVRRVQGMLAKAGRRDVEVEVIFPVSPDAITTTSQVTQRPVPSLPGLFMCADVLLYTQATTSGTPADLGGLQVVPGPAAGEGCSAEGGCASCPYMKMNSLSSLMTVCGLIGSEAGEAMLAAYEPEKYADKVEGMTMAQAGCIPILHMRGFQQSKELPAALVADILSRHLQ